jgi:hypothetical protein
VSDSSDPHLSDLSDLEVHLDDRWQPAQLMGFSHFDRGNWWYVSYVDCQGATRVGSVLSRDLRFSA